MIKVLMAYNQPKPPSNYECDFCQDKGWFEFYCPETNTEGRYDYCFKCGRSEDIRRDQEMTEKRKRYCECGNVWEVEVLVGVENHGPYYGTEEILELVNDEDAICHGCGNEDTSF